MTAPIVERCDIRALPEEELTSWMESIGHEKYRARQILKWLNATHVENFSEMTDLPASLRRILSETFTIKRVHLKDELQSSIDGTVKLLYESENGLFEGVLIPSHYGITLCVSVQVGCGMGCVFCATGYMGLKSNLSYYEMMDQVIIGNDRARYYYGRNLTNIVIMGMGEPLMNLKPLLRFLQCVDKYWKIPPHRITVSTVGIVKGILSLAECTAGYRLAVSLHSAIQETRQKLIPVARSNTLPELAEAIKHYKKSTGARVTLEYVLLDGINDDFEHIRALGLFARECDCPVNLIQYNPIPQRGDLRASSEEKVNEVIKWLKSMYVYASYRRSRGRDIMAGCGQLATKPPR